MPQDDPKPTPELLEAAKEAYKVLIKLSLEPGDAADNASLKLIAAIAGEGARQ